MSTRWPSILALLGVIVFGILMALRGQVSGTAARAGIAALAFACFGASLAWFLSRRRSAQR